MLPLLQDYSSAEEHAGTFSLWPRLVGYHLCMLEDVWLLMNDRTQQNPAKETHQVLLDTCCTELGDNETKMNRKEVNRKIYYFRNSFRGSTENKLENIKCKLSVRNTSKKAKAKLKISPV